LVLPFAIIDMVCKYGRLSGKAHPVMNPDPERATITENMLNGFDIIGYRSGHESLPTG
jgi:hypothetical protein